MPAQREIYLLSPKQLSPETIAVAFAKTSRSPEPFRVIAAELSDEKSAQFHERWVVGYGHASVAEHAVLHIAAENISRLAIESLESNRLASYTEKSTRYQVWDLDSYYTPQEIASSPHAAAYRGVCDRLFATYRECLDPVRQVIRAQYPRRPEESETRWDGRIRSKYVDCCRYLLPAAALANVGMTANARVLESAIRKMLSHPLAEVREIGAEVKAVALGEVPTLVKYADAVPYQVETVAALTAAAQRLAGAGPHAAPARLVHWDQDGEDRFLAAGLYRYGSASYEQCLGVVRAMDAGQKDALAADALGRLDKHDVPLRELEHMSYTFDAVMDQGGYFEVKRHRMMTQSPQRLTTRLGYAVPRALDEAGVGAAYHEAMQAAADVYERLAPDLPDEASYVVSNGFNRRVLLTLNLREAFHFCELRTAPHAHFAVRRTAGQVAAEIARVHPRLARFFRLGDYPGWQAIEAEHFAAVAR